MTDGRRSRVPSVSEQHRLGELTSMPKMIQLGNARTSAPLCVNTGATSPRS